MLKIGFIFVVHLFVLLKCLPISESAAVSKTSTVPDQCEGCHVVVDLVGKNFHNASRDQVRQNFMKACSKMGLLNSCNNLNATHFNQIYEHLEKNLYANDFCFLTEECSTRLNISMSSTIKTLHDFPSGNFDKQCELCKQLVKDVQDRLVSPSKDELHELLLDKCKESESFRSDCSVIVDEFYPLIYDLLLDKLNLTTSVCSLLGICNGPPGFSLFGAVSTQPIPAVQTVKPIPKPTAITRKPEVGRIPSPSYSGISNVLWAPSEPSPFFSLFSYNSHDSGFGSGIGLAETGAGLGFGAVLGAGAVLLPLGG